MSEKYPIFISYYTGDPYYEECSNNLKSSCDNLGINIEIEKLPDLNCYWKNTLQKPSYILRKFKEIESDIIWIDIDTKIYQYNECFKNWDSDILLASSDGKLRGIKASPIGIKYNERSLKFITEWEKMCSIRIDREEIDLDHDILKYEILPTMTGNLSLQIMSDGIDPKNFTEGVIVESGISKIPDKWKAMQKVISKNKFRIDNFNSLSINDFIK
jgi:hypothetical protein